MNTRARLLLEELARVNNDLAVARDRVERLSDDRRVLYRRSRAAGATVVEIARVVGVTPWAVRRYL
ncbi:hypothetical protein UFOVP1305_13 [uncultured Caudovirales phage]|uniref:Uncharacterized protein n=1 Tax=uncultured Caudovirales phage TaxID=2100421 RepID=A0A6J5PKD8_9CAUD|nr:hypothetical protein UFOVP896_51 [uncultured Caudovirales phage]CAB4197421.1 hypothetical protein UFOVP1305_13 [uncultured Caudovirales phage]